MYELTQLTDNDYYFESPSKIGLVKISDNEAVLIDSGNDKDAAKRVYRTLQEKGWSLRAIYNTHSHADHIGGNRFLQEKTGCDIFAKGMDCIYANNPILEPIGLYGARPFKELKHKFLLAEESKVKPLTGDVLPNGMKLLDLSGHSSDMVGFITKDGTAFIADTVCSEVTLEKYGISYLWDVEGTLSTLEYIKTVDAVRFVPSHAPVTNDIKDLANLNIQAIISVKEKIIELCRQPVTFEQLLKDIFDVYGQEMNARQYALVGSTVRSYLTGLYEQGAVTFEFCENRMLWRSQPKTDL